MADNHSDGSEIRRVPAIAEMMVALPRGAKRAIMVGADAIAIPASLWVAFVLEIRFADAGARRASVVLRGRAHFCVARLLRPRPVSRRHSLHWSKDDAEGRRWRDACPRPSLVRYDRFDNGAQVPMSALAIYWAARAAVRGRQPFFRPIPFLPHRATVIRRTRVAIYGAGDAGARLASVLIGGPDFEPVVVHRRQEGVAGEPDQRPPRCRVPASCPRS